MYLKRLEIQGFKSFPEKTVLTFGNDITAIVGPNGSGKSNISDALRWVMGEQSSRSLRGTKMEDVIFGGTQSRRQLGFAEVSLVVDNSAHILPLEESEVMVTRRYYRSGESEYYINRRSVRLRDVNELFMDTGLGREGYSIIGQGRIDEILSIKSEDRREIFEEAAGISRFRHRKEESERKLAHTEDNLLRINDKIGELELQVEPLREQAAKAKQYLRYRDELRGLEISVWLETLEKLKAGAEELNRNYEAACQQRDGEGKALEALYAQSEQLSEQMRDCDRRAEALREEVARLDNERSGKDSEAAVLRSSGENNRENRRRLEQEMTRQQEQAGGLSQQIQEGEERIRLLKEQETALREVLEQDRLAAEELGRSAGDAAERMGALQQQEILESAAVADARAELSALEAAGQALADRERALERDLAEAGNRLEEQNKAVAALEAELGSVREEQQSVANVIQGYELRMNSRRKREEEAADRQRKLGLEGSALDSRVRLLTDMKREYEGYSKAVREVMQAAEKGGLEHIHGPVADLLKVPERYSTAVETALGAALQNIVVDREEDAKRAITYLKRRDGGRATFLPLSAIRSRPFGDEAARKEPGFLGLASEVVEADSRYREIVGNLLGRTVLAEDMDGAIAMARKFSHRFRIVTLDGQVLNAGGSMTGGSAGRNAGILSRAVELERLLVEQKELSGRIREADEALETARREATAARYEWDTAREQQRELENRRLVLEGEAGQQKALWTEMDQRRQALKGERQELQRRTREGRAAAERCQEKIRAREEEIRRIHAIWESENSDQSQLREQTEHLAVQAAERRASLAALTAEQSAIARSLEDLVSLHGDLCAGQEAQKQRLLELDRLEGEMTEALRQAEAESLALRQRSEDMGAQLKAVEQKRMDLEGDRTRREKESQEKNRLLTDLNGECFRLEQKKLTADLEEKQILDRLWENYELSHSDALAQRVELESLSAANRRIGELKRAIHGLGNPNIGAIEEFERVNTRYEYLTGQRDDVEKARGELNGIIDDITKQMKDLFREQFARINESFKETFLELFGGGRASLELEDPDDILNCGIEIKVQPPGKSLKTISLLSGGEKAFVAIALYFAILKVRPTPFCVLDEIEAALDDVNIRRFTRYLRAMAERTQFIVITHRRGTMEEADVLYGVTMQEQGVSKMLTINLNDVEKELRIK